MTQFAELGRALSASLQRLRRTPSALPEDALSPPWQIAFAASVVVLAIKAPDSLSHPQFWAEDGSNFFSDQYGRALPPIFTPYAGYLHVIPRLVAWMSAPFGPELAPRLYACAALLIGACGLTALRQLRLEGVPFLVLLLAIALTPTNGEVFGTLTNVQWLLQFYQLSIIARAVHGHESRFPAGRACVAVLVGLSGPFSIFAVAAVAACWALARLVRARRPESHVPEIHPTPELAALAACAAIQLMFIVGAPEAGGGSPVGIKDIARVVSSIQVHLFHGELVSRRTFRLSIYAFTALALWSARGHTRWLLFALLVFVALSLAAVIRKCAGQIEGVTVFGAGDRYFVVLKALAWWQVAIVVVRAGEALSLSAASRTGIVVVCLGISAALAGSLQRPLLADMQWASYAARIGTGGTMAIPINPAGWNIVLPPPRAPTPSSPRTKAALRLSP